MAPPSSGLRLGFVDINPDAKSKDVPSGVTQSTPSKTPTSFSFHLDNEMGPEARNMMDRIRSELRVDTDRIKAELAASNDRVSLEDELKNRRIAQAKGKSSRYSAAHMAEFKKMDSIENHPSLYRVNNERFTPFKGGTKRSQEKADLDEPEPASANGTFLRSKSKVSKVSEMQGPAQESSIKRLRKRFEDDASAARPISRDGSAIPRPKSSGNDSVHRGLPRSKTHGSLMTPTKASLARTSSVKSPTVTLVRSSTKNEITKTEGTPKDGSPLRPSKLHVGISGLSGLVRSSSKKGFAGLTKSNTTSNLLEARNTPTQIQTPGRFGKVKSILKRQLSGGQPHTAQSPIKTPETQKELPPIPLTTPGKKAVKHVDFTPKTKLAAAARVSPSPVKSGIPRSKTLSKIPMSCGKLTSTALKDQKVESEVLYPDLSAYTKDLDEEMEDVEKPQSKPLPPTVPGSFTFRSDHTIKFEDHPIEGFGNAAGQSSVRHVRKSHMFGATKTLFASRSPMPGSFPSTSDTIKSGATTKEAKENKENADPKTTPTPFRFTPYSVKGIPHGMSNKKRSRAASDDENENEKDEGAERGAKKQRKNQPAVPEGDALLAPRLADGPSPKKKLSHSATPRKRGGGISLSRLNMLARPKVRK